MEVLSGDSQRLALANDVCRFDRSNQRPSCWYGPRALHCSQPPLDGSMVRLDPVVGIASGSVPTASRQSPCTLQVADRSWITPQPVPSKTRAAHGCRDSPAPSSESISLLPDRASLKDRSLLSDLGRQPHGTDTAIARQSGRRSHPGARSRTSVSIDREAADARPVRTAGSNAKWLCGPQPSPLCHQFLRIPETQRKPAIPPHASHNDGWLELALTEQGRLTDSHAINLSDPSMQHFHPDTILAKHRMQLSRNTAFSKGAAKLPPQVSLPRQ